MSRKIEPKFPKAETNGRNGTLLKDVQAKVKQDSPEIEESDENVMISTYQKEDTIGDFKVYPNSGTVAFGSTLYEWGFTLSHQSSIIGISGTIRKKNSIIFDFSYIFFFNSN